jgi:hypothetical protein
MVRPSSADINIAQPIGGNYPQKMSARAAHFGGAFTAEKRPAGGGRPVVVDSPLGTTVSAFTANDNKLPRTTAPQIAERSVISAWLQGRVLLHAQGFLRGAHKTRDLLRCRLWENIGDLSPSLLRCVPVVNDLADCVRGF